MAPNLINQADRNPRVARVRPLISYRWRGASRRPNGQEEM